MRIEHSQNLACFLQHFITFILQKVNPVLLGPVRSQKTSICWCHWYTLSIKLQNLTDFLSNSNKSRAPSAQRAEHTQKTKKNHVPIVFFYIVDYYIHSTQQSTLIKNDLSSSKYILIKNMKRKRDKMDTPLALIYALDGTSVPILEMEHHLMIQIQFAYFQATFY